MQRERTARHRRRGASHCSAMGTHGVDLSTSGDFSHTNLSSTTSGSGFACDPQCHAVAQ
jgi:hypothetical protein